MFRMSRSAHKIPRRAPLSPLSIGLVTIRNGVLPRPGPGFPNVPSRGFAKGGGGGGGAFPGMTIGPQYQKGEALKEHVCPLHYCAWVPKNNMVDL